MNKKIDMIKKVKKKASKVKKAVSKKRSSLEDVVNAYAEIDDIGTPSMDDDRADGNDVNPKEDIGNARGRAPINFGGCYLSGVMVNVRLTRSQEKFMKTMMERNSCVKMSDAIRLAMDYVIENNIDVYEYFIGKGKYPHLDKGYK